MEAEKCICHPAEQTLELNTQIFLLKNPMSSRRRAAMAQLLSLVGVVVSSVLVEDSIVGLLHRHRACYFRAVRMSSSLLRINSQRSLQLYFYPGLLLSFGTFVLAAERSYHPSTWKHD